MSGQVLENKDIDRSDLLDILDSIPSNMLGMISGQDVPKMTREVQTDPPVDALMMKSAEKSMKRRHKSIISKPGNALAKAINKAIMKNREKQTPMTDANAYKLIGKILI